MSDESPRNDGAAIARFAREAHETHAGRADRAPSGEAEGRLP